MQSMLLNWTFSPTLDRLCNYLPSTTILFHTFQKLFVLLFTPVTIISLCFCLYIFRQKLWFSLFSDTIGHYYWGVILLTILCRLFLVDLYGYWLIFHIGVDGVFLACHRIYLDQTFIFFDLRWIFLGRDMRMFLEHRVRFKKSCLFIVLSILNAHLVTVFDMMVLIFIFFNWHMIIGLNLAEFLCSWICTAQTSTATKISTFHHFTLNL